MVLAGGETEAKHGGPWPSPSAPRCREGPGPAQVCPAARLAAGRPHPALGDSSPPLSRRPQGSDGPCSLPLARAQAEGPGREARGDRPFHVPAARLAAPPSAAEGAVRPMLDTPATPSGLTEGARRQVREPRNGTNPAAKLPAPPPRSPRVKEQRLISGSRPPCRPRRPERWPVMLAPGTLRVGTGRRLEALERAAGTDPLASPRGHGRSRSRHATLTPRLPATPAHSASSRKRGLNTHGG